MTLANKLLLATNKEVKVVKVVKGAVEFVSSTAMTITPKYTNDGVTLQYSLNGSTWTTIASGATTPSANIIYFRGSATGTKSLYTNNSVAANSWTFAGSTNLECNGKLDRLIQNSLGNDNDILAIDSFCFATMFQNVSTLIKAPELPATTSAAHCYYGMFQNCTSLTTPPALPATTTSIYCYLRMFLGCTRLTIVPKLYATTLSDYCYYGMFQNCTSLKLSTTMTGIYDTAYRIPTTGTGTTGTQSIDVMFAGTGGTFTGTPSINVTYYTENTPV